jgi:hypothetical protein
MSKCCGTCKYKDSNNYCDKVRELWLSRTIPAIRDVEPVKDDAGKHCPLYEAKDEKE